ncbi:MAG: glycosyltransferase family 2 protein [Clostridia bacterium]|nr:glycosyltransferase family 2 protein [Clostridia bacterium]
MLKLIYYIIDMAVILYGVYFAVTGLYAFKRKKKAVIREYKPKNRFAILIAARNESKVIGSLISSLNKQNYPKDLYDIYVIPNNCTDNTVAISEYHGAKIIDCDIEISSKGQALKYAFDNILRNNDVYDAFCVFDADNVVHPNFLKRMSDTLCEGYQVAQGYRDSKNPSDSWISSCYSLFYWTQNYFFNQARMNLGWSASINGTGFMLSSKVLKSNGFNTVTMTEDIEFAAQCACNNERIAFVKDAITYDEQPTTFIQSWKQRKRWSMGTMQCLYNYCKPLMKKGIKSDIPQCLDMLLFFMAPFVQILGFILLVILIGYNMLNIELNDIWQVAYVYKWIAAVITYVVSILISCTVVILEDKKITKVYIGIFTLLIFMISWLPINIYCLFSRKYEWEPIEHDKVLDIESIT